MNPEDAFKLVETGRQEQIYIGRQIKNRFKKFFENPSVLDESEFRPTSERRNRDSAKAFLTGLFDENTAKNITLKEPPQNDTLLRFYRHCDKYEATVSNKSLVEYDKFIKRPEIAEVLRKVTRKLGKNSQISFNTLKLLHESCSFEYGIYGDAPWCSLLEPNDLDVLEYANDLQSFWRDSYPHKISYEQTCELTRDIWKKLSLAKSGSKQKIVGRWTHLPAINMLYTRLGLFKDEKQLLHSNYKEHLKRKWKMTLISPMSCNIAFVLLRCDTNYKVRVYHNEKTIKLEGICKEIDCDWNEIEKVFKPISDNCNFEKICKVDKNSSENLIFYSKIIIILPFLMKYLLI
ncbi:DgyrCDS9117 [Dimorphilus gyrociliatus]|uniref:Multiple inositol polyphosphate phosphatase 1 n=1 Tax=Dimorphilus gyrociliatus TaxID=2664684 RepID=A0A7I8VXK9_9ANNE|nr:DgyrCDS9117 [Dimorphilus gyrociliatus]